MEKTYSIGELAAQAYLRDAGHPQTNTTGYECAEGKADLVCIDADATTLVIVTAKRQRGEVKEPEFSYKRLQHIAMCFLVEHPEVDALRFDVIEALIGTGATVSVNALEGAYYWER